MLLYAVVFIFATLGSILGAFGQYLRTYRASGSYVGTRARRKWENSFVAGVTLESLGELLGNWVTSAISYQYASFLFSILYMLLFERLSAGESSPYKLLFL